MSLGWLGGVVVGLLAVAGGARAEVTRETVMPEGAKTLLRVHAEGVQIYECAPGARGGAVWRFREPLATLMEDGDPAGGRKTVGRHFAGPGWELGDGSLVRGRVVAQAPGESGRDVPWLRLAVVGRSGNGMLTKATAVVRIETRGGVFGGACGTVGAIHLEPYSAAYVFLGG